MAELGAIASIVGLAGAGIKVSFALFDLADRIGSAGDEVKSFATELSLFCSVLQEVDNVLQDTANTRLTPAALSLVEEVTRRCRDVITYIEGIVGSLTKDQNPFDLPSIEWKGRVKWIFKRSKIQVQRQTLESCKSTLQLLLTTLRWSRRYSTPKVAPYAAGPDGDQYQLVAQGLVLAVRSAVNQLRELEEKAENEDVDDGQQSSQRQSPSMTKLFESLTLTKVSSPTSRPNTIRRTSTWLDKLVFEDSTATEAHPGDRWHRFSSATTVNDPLLLLHKWTEARPRRIPNNDDENTPPPVFTSMDFGNKSNGAVMSVTKNTPTAINTKIARVRTFGISPTSTWNVMPDHMPVSAAVALPQLPEPIEEDWSTISRDRWISLMVNELGLGQVMDGYELVVNYGGHERVLSSSEKPFGIFEDLSRYNLNPQLVLRRGDVRNESDSEIQHKSNGVVAVSSMYVGGKA